MVSDTNINYFFLQTKFFPHKTKRGCTFLHFSTTYKVYFLLNTDLKSEYYYKFLVIYVVKLSFIPSMCGINSLLLL